MGDTPRKWWVYVVRGIAAIAFGIAAWAWPNLTIGTLVILFGIFAIIDGILSIWAALGTDAEGQRLSLILAGLAGIADRRHQHRLAGADGHHGRVPDRYLGHFGRLLQIFSAWQLRNEIENEWLPDASPGQGE